MPLLADAKDLENVSIVPSDVLKGGQLLTKVAYGRLMSLILAVREPGYHSPPHVHDAEQLNYVATGEIWLFTEDGGFLAKEGDVFRVPAGKIHWSWIRSSESCLLIEAHSPPLVGDPGVIDRATPLFDQDEDSAVPAISENRFVEFDRVHEIELAVCGETE